MDGRHDTDVSLSVVIPLYNEAEVFAELIARLQSVMDVLPFSVEVLLIDDGSSDFTPALIRRATEEDRRFRGLILSRNFGHQIAVTAGLREARGEAVAILDGDLQDPPELLGDLYARLQEGYDVVYAVRRHRKESAWKRAAYHLFYRLLRRMATIPIPLDSGDFSMMRRCVVDAVNQLPERHRFVRGLRSWVGFRQTAYLYERARRAGGQPKYTLAKLLRLALDGIFTFSETPLRWATYAGCLAALAASVWGAYIIVWRLLDGGSLPGFATLAAAVLLLGGMQLISIGILGEYIGRIHNEVKGRPLYLVARQYPPEDGEQRQLWARGETTDGRRKLPSAA